PYWVIDTHAGAGIYDMSGDWASGKPQTGSSGNGLQRTVSNAAESSPQRRPESDDGVRRLLQAEQQPELISQYLEALQAFNSGDSLRFYPGSPWLTLQAMRDRDRLRLFEFHPSEFEILQHNLRQH